MVEDAPEDAVFEEADVEVQEQAAGEARELEIGDQLSFVDGSEGINALDLDDHPSFDQEVDAVAAVELDAVVDNRKRDLALNAQAGFGEFVAQTHLIGGFEQARAESAVNSDRAADDLPRDGIIDHLFRARNLEFSLKVHALISAFSATLR